MNQLIFASRNIFDKAVKIANDPTLLSFYLREYVWKRFECLQPNCFIVSYPKCGRTWLRIMLLEYINSMGHKQFHSYDNSIIFAPKSKIIKFDHDQGSWVPAPIKSKDIIFKQSKYAQKKVVFLIRDPRDILISSWYHLRYRENIFHRDLSFFIRSELVGIHKIIAFMNSWVENAHLLDEILILSYETLRTDTPLFFSRILDFFDIPKEEKLVLQTIQFSSFDKMKKRELHNKRVAPWLRCGTGGEGNMEKSSKIRKGKIGGYRDELTVSDINYLNDAMQKELSPLILSYIPSLNELV